jgi:hypothetical protein
METITLGAIKVNFKILKTIILAIQIDDFFFFYEEAKLAHSNWHQRESNLRREL